MAKQKKEDNRDVFEKALDAAPLAGMYGGAALGATIAGKLAARSTRKWAKKNNWSKRDTDEIARGDARVMAVPGGFAGAVSGLIGGGVAREMASNKKRRK